MYTDYYYSVISNGIKLEHFGATEIIINSPVYVGLIYGDGFMKLYSNNEVVCFNFCLYLVCSVLTSTMYHYLTIAFNFLSVKLSIRIARPPQSSSIFFNFRKLPPSSYFAFKRNINWQFLLKSHQT